MLLAQRFLCTRSSLDRQERLHCLYYTTVFPKNDSGKQSRCVTLSMCLEPICGVFISSLVFSLCLCVSIFKSVQFLFGFHEPRYAAVLNMGSSAKSFSTRVSPATTAAHWAETEVGRAWMLGSISPGIWGSGLRGRVTATSGPAAGTSGEGGTG